MDPDEIVIEYLRGKLAKARGARADAIMKPPETPMEEVAEGEDPEQMAQLEALMQESPEAPMAKPEACPECGGAIGECECTKAM